MGRDRRTSWPRPCPTPLYGKLGDLYGRKIVLQTAIVIFLVGSALCGIAQNMAELIAFRALQGLGAGGLIVTTMAVVGDIVPPRDRGRYQGFFGAVFGVSTVVGPLLGGFLVDHLSWRWIFYVNIPVGIAALAAIAVAFHPRTSHRKHTIDYAGAVLLAGGLSGIVLYTSLGGTTYDWTSPSDAGSARARCRAPRRLRARGAQGGGAGPSAQPVQQPDVRDRPARSASSSASRCSARSPSSRCTSRSSKVRARPCPGCSSRR